MLLALLSEVAVAMARHEQESRIETKMEKRRMKTHEVRPSTESMV